MIYFLFYYRESCWTLIKLINSSDGSVNWVIGKCLVQIKLKVYLYEQTIVGYIIFTAFRNFPLLKGKYRSRNKAFKWSLATDVPWFTKQLGLYNTIIVQLLNLNSNPNHQKTPCTLFKGLNLLVCIHKPVCWHK